MKTSPTQKIEAMIGKTYNRLLVLNFAGKVSYTNFINCKCSCGQIIKIRYSNVLDNSTKSCGCLARENRRKLINKQKLEAKLKAESLIGKKFGALIITKTSDKKTKFGHAYVKADCSCGKKDVDVMVSSLFNRRVLSCGCRIIGGKKDRKYSDPKLSIAKKVYSASYKDGDISFDQFLELSQKNCFYCGVPPKNLFKTFSYNGLDRVDNSRNHTNDNVITCCVDCNKAKMTRTFSEFLNWVNNIYIKHIEKK